MHFGIDYGSKLAGTTVITYDIQGKLFQICSEKKKDADSMIKDAAAELKPSSIFIDAPLSLPNAYYGKGDDYFYRKADKELKAMSPMFLGGLTARAMKLSAYIRKMNIEVFETYPGALVRSTPTLKEVYTKKGSPHIFELMKRVSTLLSEFDITDQILNLHQVDSLLAWYSGYKHINSNSIKVGDVEEGMIIY